MTGRLLLSQLLLFALMLACGNVAARPRTSAELKAQPSVEESGGDFALIDQDGKRFELKELRGKVVLLYFGYTSCTEACPLMLTKVSSVFRLLGQLREEVSVLLVTLDPARDTPLKLKQYLQYFKVNGIGLTGTKEEIDKVVEQYGARYEVERGDSAMGYHINHTTDLYMIDRSGKLRQRFKHDERAETISKAIKQLLGQ